MSWFEPDRNAHGKKDEKEKETMTQRFFTACLLILGGVIVLVIALEFVSQIWGWLVLAAVITLAIWVAVRAIGARRDRW
ncbi:hypothetical protein [Microbacterium sp.]|uniref:hypothetical protein n=1 Tax=Microbacterium sp. TaxID=51671 RepID=UPI0025F4FF7F|nr:hypothetical protein [Microbacterium sp.]MBT9605912.1 hypothetical protein [Microbacterium sp.]